MSTSPQTFAQRVLAWFARHGRQDLPWQQTPTLYRVWISEIMLQQTQVAVVIPYFERFMGRFPTLPDLAEAPLDAVLAHWSGLGYYARARNLHRAADQIREQHGGRFPTALDQVQALPGIGRSTAGAILSLAAGQCHPILDGNVKRVLARHFGIEGWSGRAEVLAALWRVSEACTPADRAGDYNQAMMDLGATLCTRTRPDCVRCPLSDTCIARSQGRQRELPAPRPRKPLPERATLMLVVINSAGEILLERRPPTGIWGGLWSLPETSAKTEPEQWCQNQMGLPPLRVDMLAPRRHTFTHYSLMIRIAAITVETTPDSIADGEHLRWLSVAQASELGLPAPVRKILLALAR